MDFDLSRVPTADLILSALGVVILLGACARSTIRRTWAADLRMPSPPENRVDRFDVVLAAWLYVTLGMLGAMIARGVVTGDAIPTTQAAGGGPAASSATILGGTIGGVCAAILLYLIGRRRFEGGTRGWGLNFARLDKQLAVALLVTIATLPVCYALLGATEWVMETLFHVVPAEHESINWLRKENGPEWTNVLTVLNALAIAPIAEELLFRGILLPALARWLRSPAAGLVVSAVLFGLIHFSVMKTVPALIVFGLVLGATYLKRRSLVTSILVHSMFNAKTIIWLLLGLGS